MVSLKLKNYNDKNSKKSYYKYIFLYDSRVFIKKKKKKPFPNTLTYLEKTVLL